jgi:hypothetical protein
MNEEKWKLIEERISLCSRAIKTMDDSDRLKYLSDFLRTEIESAENDVRLEMCDNCKLAREHGIGVTGIYKVCI